MRDGSAWSAMVIAVSLAAACGGGDEDKDGAMEAQGDLTCSADKQVDCTCDDGRTLKTCMVGRRAATCPCFGNSNGSGVDQTQLKPQGTGGAATGTGGAPATTGGAGMDASGGNAGTGGSMMGSGGAPWMFPMGSGGMSAGTGGAPMAGSGGSDGGEATGTEEVERLRQVCVDTINMYRATVQVTPALEPLARGTHDDETCSDMGAKIDGDSGQAHKSAGMCMGYGGQDACPGWPVGARGYATLEQALLDCLKKMWDEGEPPVPRAECQKDYEGCFLKYGHYLNMSDPNYSGVVCGFYLMKDGMSWWMNQDFKSKPWGGG
jgi:hypothetical protein